jgi:hypothetical protein
LLHQSGRQIQTISESQGTHHGRLTKLQAATARIELAITNLPVPPPDQQPEIDAITTRLETGAATLEAKATPPAPTPTP